MEELIKRAKSGDKDAFTKAVQSVKEELNNIVKTKVRNEDDIEDIVQNTIEKGFLKLKQLRNNKYFKTWIIRILINECNKFYELKNKEEKLVEKCIKDIRDTTIYEMEIGRIEFEDRIKDLDKLDKEIMNLYFEEKYTINEIAEILKMNSNTVKSRINRGKKKIKSKYEKTIITVIILCVLTTGVVLGISSLINYLKSIFDLSSIGQNNDGILMAIEEKEWYENIEMDYIDLNENYRIKIDYMILDDINLYLIFNLESSENIQQYNRISVLDLEIVDEQGNIIWLQGDRNNEYIVKLQGYKGIENSEYNIKELVYMIADGYPEFKELKIRFSKVLLYNEDDECKNTYEIGVDKQNEISISISEKFINKETTKYETSVNNNIEVKRAIICETGFYAIVKSNKGGIKATLKDESNNEYICGKSLISIYDENNNNYYIITAKLLDKTNRKLFLKIDDKEIELIKK